MEQNETKNEKFKRIATLRVNNVIRIIESIGKLSASSYEYSNEEVEKIFSSLQETLDKVKSLFSVKKNEAKKFEL